MTHISKKDLGRELEAALIGSFDAALVGSAKDRILSEFLQIILTRTERIMLAKRLVAHYLIAKDYPDSQICTGLGLSAMTVWRLRIEHREAGPKLAQAFVHISQRERVARSTEQSERLGDILEEVLGRLNRQTFRKYTFVEPFTKETKKRSLKSNLK